MIDHDDQAATHRDRKDPKPPVASARAEFTESDAAAASRAAAITVIPAKKQKRASLHWHDVHRVGADS